MSGRGKGARGGAMLDLWRPPHGAGDPVGCLSTTFTFSPGMFDEQCLARFLEIESEPNREDLAFLLERESRLGSVYAGILVDHTQAGVAHSLRWDVLPVRVRGGKQHAKLSLLAWSRHVRIIVASANMTEPGYRSNSEVAGTIECGPDNADADGLAEATGFLRGLLRLVPGADDQGPEVGRALGFLQQVERLARLWAARRRRGRVRQRLIFTRPAAGTGFPARGGLEEMMDACRTRGGSPREAWFASPFFDMDSEANRAAAALCKAMARGTRRSVCFCVPAAGDAEANRRPRLAAPKSLLLTPRNYGADVAVEILPAVDEDKNRRPWHAKMVWMEADEYTALMVGSSNFTCAGLGIGSHRNTEANLLTLVDYEAYGRATGELNAVWPESERVADPDAAEWTGTSPDGEEEEQAGTPPLPGGFIAAIYRAGDRRSVVLRLDPDNLPSSWRIVACGHDEQELLSSETWIQGGRRPVTECAWPPVQPPEKILVRWADCEAFLPLNVEDGRRLPPPAQLERMSADDMLMILAASDPSGAFRIWARRQQPATSDEDDLDSAVPPDLDPLRRYDIHATYLHRIRHRARVLARLRANLERPVWGRQALEWRLRGLVGVEQLANRLVREAVRSEGAFGEAMLTLADFLIVLHEVRYQPADGSLPKADFDEVFRGFLRDLARRLDQETGACRGTLAADLVQFWDRVVQRCAE